MVEEVLRMEDEDIASNRAIGAYGAELLGPGTKVLTHCNAGPWPPPGTAPAWAPCFWPRSGASPFTPGVMKPAPSCKAPV